MNIYDAAMRYREEGTPLIVIAGREYGSGSSRAWAAKGPASMLAIGKDGSQTTFEATMRVDAPDQVEYSANGGILDMVLRQLLHSPSHSSGRSRDRSG